MMNQFAQLERQIKELESERHYGTPLPRLRSDEFTVAYCQGNLIRSYNMAFLRHLVVRVGDAAAARQFLLDVTDESVPGPLVTTAANWEKLAKPPRDTESHLIIDEPHDQELMDRRSPTAETWDGKPATCLNVGISATGLKALGLNDDSYNTFPEEFRQGAARRASKVGDVDGSAPKYWQDGFGDESKVHLMWTVHSGTQENLEAACADLEASWQASSAFSVTSRLDGAQLPDKVTDKPGHDVHFDYRDDIAQPRFQLDRFGEFGVEREYVGERDHQPEVPLGALLQSPDGATSFDEVKWQVPELVTAEGRNPALSQYGCYNAFRKMEQDVETFENFLETEAGKLGWNKEYLAAKLMGRWRSGVPIIYTRDHATWSAPDAVMPTVPDPEVQWQEPDGVFYHQDGLNGFDFASDYVERVTELGVVKTDGDEIAGVTTEAFEIVDDRDGASCPLGSHIRRSNPRRGRIVQRSANHTRQIVRRGMPYGPRFDPDEDRGDGKKRGLLGSFFCGSLIAQFESMMYDWINMGLQDPRITGTNCPIIGANNPGSSRFDIPLDPDPAYPDRPERVTIRGFPRFVETVGAAYFFYPGVPGLRLLGTMK